MDQHEENKEKKNRYETQQKAVDSMKFNYEMAIEENKELKLKVDKQQHNIKHLLEQCDVVDKEKFRILKLLEPPLKRINLEIHVQLVKTDLQRNN